MPASTTSRGKKPKKTVQAKAEYASNSEEEAEKDDEFEGDAAWGKQKSAYYSADYVESDEDDALDEEKEALRLQKERLQQLGDGNFLDMEFWKSSGGDNADGDVEDAKVEVFFEKVSTADVSKMGKKQFYEYVNRQAPEFLGLVKRHGKVPCPFERNPCRAEQ